MDVRDFQQSISAARISTRDTPQRSLAITALIAVVAAAGCPARPSAPALSDEAVYKNQREGFRFTLGEGWKQNAKGEVPAGKVVGERMLVEYRCLTCAKPATLEVTVADVDAATSLSDYVSSHNLTGEQWKLKGKAEDFKINGATAVRLLYSLRADKEELVREIVAFRRGERVYFFKGFYTQSDGPSRRVIRSVVDSVVW